MLIGADIECFVRSRTTGGYLAACGMLDGAKGAPFSLGEGYGVQEDNVTVEFNVPPAKSAQEFFNILTVGKRKVQEYVSTRFAEPVSLQFISAATLASSQLRHPLAKQFGCVPELDAYGMGSSFPRPKMGTTRSRCAGFHLHFGFRGEDELAVPGFVATTLFEALLHHDGINIVVDDTHNGAGTARKRYYGKPGSYRDTTYPDGYFGFEYRCMGAGAFNELRTVANTLDTLWPHLERLLSNRELAASIYRELDLVALRSRVFSPLNRQLIRTKVYGE